MTRVVLLSAAGGSQGAAAARMDGFNAGLMRRGWHVYDIRIPTYEVTGVQAILDRAPYPVRTTLERLGWEGDVMPSIGRRAAPYFRGLEADVAVASVPPFSLLYSAAKHLPARLPLVVDYRDPWAARRYPPPFARMSRHFERLLLDRVSAVTHAGGAQLGHLLTSRLGVPPDRIHAVPNGFDHAHLDGIPPWRHRAERHGKPLDLVFGGYWYGRNGPGIVTDALAQLPSDLVTLTVCGDASPPIRRQLSRRLATPPRYVPPLHRIDLYRRLAQADAALITVDASTAAESRIPAKAYDYLAVGVPVIAICPPEAAIRSLPAASRFHYIRTHDVDHLIALLRNAARDRTILQPGDRAMAPTRDDAAGLLHQVLKLRRPR